MSVKGWFDFDVVVRGLDENGKTVYELRKVSFTIFDLIRSGYASDRLDMIAKDGALGLVAQKHPTWTGLTVTSCTEVF